jgi:hypothetical protein
VLGTLGKEGKGGAADSADGCGADGRNEEEGEEEAWWLWRIPGPCAWGSGVAGALDEETPGEACMSYVTDPIGLLPCTLAARVRGAFGCAWRPGPV